MNHSNHPTEEALYQQAMELTSPAEREAFLLKACAGNAELLAKVRELLACDAEAEDRQFLPTVIAGGADRLAREEPGAREPEKPGAFIGRYKLLQQIGEGGFGSVWMAEQSEPIKRRVALKIIKLGMDTREVIARFEAERQALAMMDHPNIARVLDAGATDAGRPYFVMELVKGMAVTTFCNEAKLGTRERLELFADICSAINHAHQKGIIHRDIKPSNVLVTLHADKPVAKVIDFGIAKAMQQSLTDKTLFTQHGAFIGTPTYMSPEQAALSGIDIDTRSDIYSLGVLLYELLTGKPPFDARSLISAGYEEMRRIICEEEPPKPSTRLNSATDVERITLAAARHTDPAKLCRMVRGDLDWIVMKAIEKDRTRRYETANAFAADIRRFLLDEPVLASPPSAGYKFRKFARRNKTALAVASLIFAVLVAATGISVWQAKLAIAAKQDATLKAAAESVAREESQAVTKFFIGVFQSPNPERDGRTITVAETLKRAVRKLDTDLASQPERRATLLETVGATYLALGLAREAIAPFEKARDLRIATLGPEHPDTLDAICYLADAFHKSSRRQEALKLREELLVLRRNAIEPDPLFSFNALNDLAISYHAAGRMTEALALQEEALSVSRKTVGPEDPETLTLLNTLGAIYFELGRRDEGHAMMAEALAVSRKVNGPEHPNTLMATSNLATALDFLGKHEEALKMRIDNMEPNHRVNGDDHPDTLRAMNNLAVSYLRFGRFAEALEIQEKALPISKVVLGKNDPETLGAMSNLAISYRKLARLDEAIRLQKEALELDRRFLPDGHPYLAGAVENLADCYRDAGRPDEERPLRLELEALKGQQPGPATKDPAIPAATPASEIQTVKSLEEALENIRKTTGGKNAETIAAMTALAAAHGAEGNGRKAITTGKEALTLAREVLPAGDARTIEVMKVLIPLYRYVDLEADAAKLEAELKTFPAP